MKKMRKEILPAVGVLIILALAGFGNVRHVAAQQGSGPVGGGTTIPLPNPLGPCDGFECVLKNFLAGLLKISVPIFTIMVLVGGFQIMTAAGNEERLSKGKKTILYSVVGFAILLSAYGIVSIIQEILSTGGS